MIKNSNDSQIDSILQLLLRTSDLLGHIEDKQILKDMVAEGELLKIEPGNAIFNEGDVATEIFFVLEGDFNRITIGEKIPVVQPEKFIFGNMIDFYPALKGRIYHYQAIAVDQAVIFKISKISFLKMLSTIHDLKTYIELITENIYFQQLSQEIDQIDLPFRFKVQLISSLLEKKVQPGDVISLGGLQPSQGFFIQEGSVTANQFSAEQSKHLQWKAINKSWLNLKECIEERAVSATFRAETNVRMLVLLKRDLFEIRQGFPNEFETFLAWILNSEINDKTIEEEDGEEIDLGTIFSNQKLLKKPGFVLNFPWVQQHDQMDCAAACLAMVSKYWGNELSIQFWRKKINATQLGTKMFDMAWAVEKSGFLTHPISIEKINELDLDLLPAIALRQNHYLVIYKITSAEIIAGDPAIGIVKMTHKEFNRGFEHTVLLLRPFEEFLDISSGNSNFSHYIHFAMGFSKELFIIFGISLLLVLVSLIPPFMLQMLYDRALPLGDQGLLTIVIMGCMGAAVSGGILSYARSKYVVYVSTKFDFIASSAFFKKLFSLPYDYIASKHVGDFSYRYAEMERLREFLTSQTLNIALDIMTLGLFAGALFIYSPSLLLATFVLCLIMVGLSLIFSRKLSSCYQATFASRAQQDSLMTDLIKGIPTIKTLNCEISSRWRLEERIVKTLRARNDFFTTSVSLSLISDTFNDLSRFILLGFCSYLALQGDLTPGQVISASVLFTSVLAPFNNLAHSWAGIQQAKGIALRLNDVFLTNSENVILNEGFISDNFQGEIEFQDVWFRFGGDSSDWILKEISFKILAGQNVALVGPNGSGKTTIGLLLGGLYRPTKGRILIDGRNILDYDASWLRKKMGFVLSEPSLFYGSIAENIGMSTPAVNMEKAKEVAMLSGAWEFISKKPNSMDYIITHGGLGLSSGEKQRIAFSRALYNDPKVLILDEATSALDGIAERSIIKALNANDRTMINIAHRFSTASASDYLIVLDKGRVVAIGAHDYLANTSELYLRLFNLAGSTQIQSTFLNE